MGGLTPTEFQETKTLLLSQLRTSSSFSSQSDLFGAQPDSISGSLPSHELTSPVEAPVSSMPIPPTPLMQSSLSDVYDSPSTQSVERSSVHHTSPSGVISQGIVVGQWLMGRYQIKEFLGEGGSGQTFLCYDSIRQNTYALKWIYTHLAQLQIVREQILQQLKDNERLAHPGFVRTYSVERDQSDSFLFYTMEYVDGITLDRAIERCIPAPDEPFLPVTFTLRLVEKMVGLLRFAHEHTLIHRNLKPSNIGITKDGDVKLMDAGIIKAVEEAVSRRQTSFGGVLYYMAPEQLRQRQRTVSEASDVYSLGALTYHLLTGELPVGAVVPPTQYLDVLPKEIDAILLRALDPRADKRYQSPLAFWDPLCKALAPLAANENVHTETLFSLLMSSIPAVSSAEYPAFQDSGTTAEFEKVRTADEATLTFSPMQAEVVEHQTSTDLPEVRAFPTSSLLPRLQSTDFDSNRTAEEIPTVSFHPDASLDEIDSQFGRKWSKQVGQGEEMISLESGPTPPPPSARAQRSALSHTSDLSSEISRISAISSLTVEPLAEELELELEDDRTNAPKASDLERTALELPSIDGYETNILSAKDGTPLLELVLIPEGPFLMGSREDDPLASASEMPQLSVELDSYWISRTPITNRAWSKFIEESNYHSDHPDYLRHWFAGRPSLERLEHPVVFVSHLDLMAFCEFYRLALPTEAQWEKAARGTSGQIWPWGNQKPQSGNCNFLGSNLQATSPVAAYLAGASPFGLYDCSGNVWEWCADHWSRDYFKELGDSVRNPCFINESSRQFAIRGGCFRNYGRGVRCATRHYSTERAMHISARVIQPA